MFGDPRAPAGGLQPSGAAPADDAVSSTGADVGANTDYAASSLNDADGEGGSEFGGRSEFDGSRFDPSETGSIAGSEDLGTESVAAASPAGPSVLGLSANQSPAKGKLSRSWFTGSGAVPAKLLGAGAGARGGWL